jgi:hypothetical protein
MYAEQNILQSCQQRNQRTNAVSRFLPSFPLHDDAQAKLLIRLCMFRAETMPFHFTRARHKHNRVLDAFADIGNAVCHWYVNVRMRKSVALPVPLVGKALTVNEIVGVDQPGENAVSWLVADTNS